MPSYSFSFSVQLVMTMMSEEIAHSSGALTRNRWPSGETSPKFHDFRRGRVWNSFTGTSGARSAPVGCGTVRSDRRSSGSKIAFGAESEGRSNYDISRLLGNPVFRPAPA